MCREERGEVYVMVRTSEGASLNTKLAFTSSVLLEKVSIVTGESLVMHRMGTTSFSSRRTGNRGLEREGNV